MVGLSIERLIITCNFHLFVKHAIAVGANKMAQLSTGKHVLRTLLSGS